VVAVGESVEKNPHLNKKNLATMKLLLRGRSITFPRRPLIMGILNINDDSFSGDGRIDPTWALGRSAELVAAGADLIDVGGESARTNRGPIGEDEEIARIAPFIVGFPQAVASARPADGGQIYPPLLSINTWRPAVAAAALRLGGDLLNDMGALPDDRNARSCAETGAGLLIMHSVGEPKVPHTHVAYRDVIAEMRDFFRGKIALAKAAGMPEESIVLDPGLDFAKGREDNLRVLRELDAFSEFGRPLLLPVSRKTVIGETLGIDDPRERDAGTIACLVAGALRGASIFRVHNVRAAHQALRTLEAVI